MVQGQSTGEAGLCKCCVIIMQGGHLNVVMLSDLSASFKGILVYPDSYGGSLWLSVGPKYFIYARSDLSMNLLKH